jgi:hypothetical protein
MMRQRTKASSPGSSSVTWTLSTSLASRGGHLLAMLIHQQRERTARTRLPRANAAAGPGLITGAPTISTVKCSSMLKPEQPTRPTRSQGKSQRRVIAATQRAFAPGREERMAVAKRERKAAKPARDARP